LEAVVDDSRRWRRASSASGLLAGALVVCLLAPDGSAQAAGPAVGGQAPAAAGGERWYGYVATYGQGTHTLSDGGKYTSGDSFILNAPESADQGTMNVTVNVVITHEDPDPLHDGCYVKRQTWKGSGVVPASFQVSDYRIWAEALSPVAVATMTKYGGVLGGVPCSTGDYGGSRNYSPWISIHSAKNPPNFRQGSHTVPARPSGVGGPCLPVSECTDYPAFESLPRMTSEWSIAARECTGYSKTHRLGNKDTLFVFNPQQTKCLSSRVNFLQEISGRPKVCDYAYVKRLSQACAGYKTVTRIQWSQADWFMAAATRTDACGVWVVDRADWRPPKIKPARGDDKLDLAWIPMGASRMVKTATGSMRVSCP